MNWLRWRCNAGSRAQKWPRHRSADRLSPQGQVHHRLAQGVLTVGSSSREGFMGRAHLRSIRLAAAMSGLVFMVGGCACGGRVSESEVASAKQPLAPHLGLPGLPAPGKRLKVGEDCGAYSSRGNSACESGLCLRVSQGNPSDGMRALAFCTVRCTLGTDSCPDGPTTPWRCTAIWPSQEVCTPARTWTSQVATRNGAPFQLPRPALGSTAQLPDGGVAP